MQNIDERLRTIVSRMERAERTRSHSLGPVTLIGATKTQSAATIRHAAGLGLKHVGENYLDEAIDKRTQCADLDLCWHFIGRIQSNKTKLIAQHFDWIHTLDRIKIARRLSNHCPADKQLNVLIQVNIDNDEDKGGVTPVELSEFSALVETLPNLKLRGLMCILSSKTEPSTGYASMAQLAQHANPNWDTLSMGMSGDLDAAISAGASHIRVGSALFGARS